MIDRAIRPLAFLIGTAAFLQIGIFAAEPLPPRALARIGDHRFYHGPGLRCAVLSPDGSRIASTAGDSVIVLWDASTGERLRTLRVPQENGWCLAFSPNGKQLAAAYGNFLDKFGVVIFEVETRKLLQQLGNFKREAAYLQFSADGKQLRVSELRGPVSAWDAATGKQLRLWKPPRVPPREVLRRCAARGVLAPDGKVIVWETHCFYGGLDPWLPDGLRVNDANTDKLLYQREFEPTDVRFSEPIVFCADGKRFATGYGDKLIVRETATGKESLAVDEPDMACFSLASDGWHAATCRFDSLLRLWDLKTGKPSRDLSFVPASLCAFSSDGNTLLIATNSTLRLFDTKSGKESVVPGHRAPIVPRFSADGRTLFTSCGERRCSWDVSTQKKPTLLTHERRKAWEVDCLAHSADERLFLDRPAGQGRVCEMATGRVLRELEHDDRYAAFGQFSPDATRVLCRFHEIKRRDPHGIFRLYDVKTGKASDDIKMVDRASDPVFSPNGRLIAWGDEADAVHLHDAVTGKFMRTLRPFRPLPSGLSRYGVLLFSPDSEYLIAGRPRQPMRVFQISSGREIIRFDANFEASNKDGVLSYMAMACSPDGRLLAVAEEQSGTICLLEIASGKVRAEFAGHRDGVHGLAFAPDGRTLASGGEDNVVFLWDATGARAPAAAKKSPEAWWNDLASEDAKRAGDAIADLLRKPEASVTFLQQQLRPAEFPDEKHLTRLLADLDSDAFDKREAANRELARLGEEAAAALRQAVKERPSLEMRRRLEDLLGKLERRTLPPETLRTLRAIEVLEHIGTPQARRCLDALAKGAPAARQTREAKRTLARLAKRR